MMKKLSKACLVSRCVCAHFLTGPCGQCQSSVSLSQASWLYVKEVQICRTLNLRKSSVKVTATKTLQNRMLKGNLKAALKAANAAIESDAADKAAVAQKAYKVIDQSASKGIIHKNQAARRKSQIASKLNAAKA